MAIDHIENNELGTFTEGRLGWQQFVDEGYSNYTGTEDFFNLFGSKKKKKIAATQSTNVNQPTQVVQPSQSTEIAKFNQPCSQAELSESVSTVAKTSQAAAPSQNSEPSTKTNKSYLLYAGLGVAGLLLIALMYKNK